MRGPSRRASAAARTHWGVVLSVMLSLLASSALHAATCTWNGNGTNKNWTTATNWVGSVAPVAGDDLVFPVGPAQRAPFNDYPAGTTFNSITVSNSGYALQGASVALNAGVAAYNPAGLVQVYNPLTLLSNQTISANGGSLYLQAQIDTAGHTLTFSAAGEIQTTLFSRIIGSGSLIKAGPVTVSLGGTNSYTGLTEIREGGLAGLQPSAFGSTGSGTVVSNGASVILLGGASIPEPLELYGTIQTSSGAGSATNFWTGPITLVAPGAQINTDPPLTISGLISGGGSLTKNGAGTLTLTADNTYTGATTNLFGDLLLNGSQPQSPVYLMAGFLGGTGTVGTIMAIGFGTKTLSPGGTSPLNGILTCSSVTLSASTVFRADLNGLSPGTGYDQLEVAGHRHLGWRRSGRGARIRSSRWQHLHHHQ